ncbi:hypothetical protein C3B51_13475 [Pseudoalteromonas rubra]|uniref:Uncharacterized protein n=1 Tax=Pseudoalteromonas rubra TaxID=43658 RepID=A0A4Q7EBN9_9GAMM|nr:hypothetical protein C3B51_13475 [Pseudoalteromonas rubra]
MALILHHLLTIVAVKLTAQLIPDPIRPISVLFPKIFAMRLSGTLSLATLEVNKGWPELSKLVLYERNNKDLE